MDKHIFTPLETAILQIRGRIRTFRMMREKYGHALPAAQGVADENIATMTTFLQMTEILYAAARDEQLILTAVGRMLYAITLFLHRCRIPGDENMFLQALRNVEEAALGYPFTDEQRAFLSATDAITSLSPSLFKIERVTIP